jgi:hypothetical protein
MRSGILHHLEQRDPKFVYHQSIDFDHLLGCQGGNVGRLVHRQILDGKE